MKQIETIEEYHGQLRDSRSSLTIAVGAPRSGKTTLARHLIHLWPRGLVTCCDPAYELRYRRRSIRYLTELPIAWAKSANGKNSAPPPDLPAGSLLVIDEVGDLMDDRDQAAIVRTLCRLRGVWQIHVICTTQRPVECAWIMGTADYVAAYRLTRDYDLQALERQIGVSRDEIRDLPAFACYLCDLRA